MSRVEHIGDATLYLGDCRDVLATISGVDAAVADPPYGVGLTAKQNKWVRHIGQGYLSTTDTPEFVANVVVPAIELARSAFGRVVVTPGTRCAFLYPAPDEIGLVYNRSGAGRSKWGFSCAAPVLFYGSDPHLAAGKGARPNSWEQPANDYAEECGHPCPKPIGLMSWLVERASLAGHTVLDPFMGSGTTGVACAQLGRRFIGIEIEPAYFEIACRRIEAAYAQPRLFAEPVAKPVQTSLLEGA